MIRRPPRSTQSPSSAASDVYKRQSTNLANENILSINLPAYVKSNGQEIFRPRVAEGIKNIIKNNKLPIKPKIKTKFEKMNFPMKPPDDPWGKD